MSMWLMSMWLMSMWMMSMQMTSMRMRHVCKCHGKCDAERLPKLHAG